MKTNNPHYSFPGGWHNHKLGGLTQKFIFSQYRIVQKSALKQSAKLVPSESSEGQTNADLFLGFRSPSAILGVPWVGAE